MEGWEPVVDCSIVSDVGAAASPTSEGERSICTSQNRESRSIYCTKPLRRTGAPGNESNLIRELLPCLIYRPAEGLVEGVGKRLSFN